MWITRYHDFSAGHRVPGHEGACKGLHGHNYRVHFTVGGDGQDLDPLGRVIDFAQIKERLCAWVEREWDHRMLLFDGDELGRVLFERLTADDWEEAAITFVPFRPTAEEMARFLLEEVGPRQLAGTGLRLIRVHIEETRKCSATASLD